MSIKPDMRRALAHLSLPLLVSVAACTGRGGQSGTRGDNTGAADGVTGQWTVSIAVGADTIVGLAVLAQSGTSVTGSIGPNKDNLHPLDGVRDGNRLVLTMRSQPGLTTAFAQCSLTIDGETWKGTTVGGHADKGAIRIVRLRE